MKLWLVEELQPRSFDNFPQSSCECLRLLFESVVESILGHQSWYVQEKSASESKTPKEPVTRTRTYVALLIHVGDRNVGTIWNERYFFVTTEVIVCDGKRQAKVLGVAVVILEKHEIVI